MVRFLSLTLIGHALRLGATLKEMAARRAKKQKIEDPGARQPAAVGLRVMEELLDGHLATRAKALCGSLEEADSCAAAAATVLGKPPEGEFDRALQRVARSAGSCEVVSKATHGNTLFTLRRGAEEGMEALAHRADFGKVPPGTARAGPNSQDIQEAEERDRRYISYSSTSYRLSPPSSV